MSIISEYDRYHVYELLCGYGTWFGAELIRLIGKADKENREALRKAFPDYVEAFESWDKKIGIYKDKTDN